MVRGEVAGRGECAGGEDVPHLVSEGPQGHAGDVHGQGGEPRGAGGPASEGGLPGGEDLANDNSRGLERTSAGRGERTGDAVGDNREGSEEELAAVWPSRPGEQQHGWEPPRVVMGQPKERGERGEQQRGIRAGEEADGERAPDNHDADGPGEGIVGQFRPS